MESSDIKKILPNLRVTFGIESDNNLEEGEISENEDNFDTVDQDLRKIEVDRKWMKTLHQPREYKNKDGGFSTGLDLSSDKLVKRLEERAHRFGLEMNESSQITKKEIDDLYKSFDIHLENLSIYKKIRLNTIHIRGVNAMHTKDIFDYFDDYGASSIEWIDDCSCNVIWGDETTAARAMLGMSQPLPAHIINERENFTKKKHLDENDDCFFKINEEIKDTPEEEIIKFEMEPNAQTKFTKISVPIPPGCWRQGIPHPKAKSLLLRFATKNDHKLPGSEKRSDFYQKFGNPNYGGMKGLISKSFKHKIQTAKNKQMIQYFTNKNIPASPFETEVKNTEKAKLNQQKPPRMKMYADEEEQKHMKRNHTKSIHDRLGSKYNQDELAGLGRSFYENSTDDSNDGNLTSQTITCKLPARHHIWKDIAENMFCEDTISEYSKNSQELCPSKEHLHKKFKSNNHDKFEYHCSEADDGYIKSDSRDWRPSYNHRDSNILKRKISEKPPKDLRHILKPSSSPVYENASSDSSSSSNEGDLRSKLKKHRSVLWRDED